MFRSMASIIRSREIYGGGVDTRNHRRRQRRNKSGDNFLPADCGRRWTDFCRDSSDFTLRLQLLSKHPVHDGCVNSVVWSPDGRYLLSGSDDRYLVISDPFDPEYPVKERISSGHKSNIFSARFLPCTDNRFIVSCSSDGTVILTDVDRPETYGKQCFNCHVSNTYEVGVIPNDPFSFLSCGEDGTVRLFDRRLKTRCGPCKDDVILDCERSICALDIHPMKNYLMIVGCSDSSARLYDMRMLSKPATDTVGLVGLKSVFVMPTADESSRNRRVTSVDFSPDGNDILISFSSDFVYLYSLNEFSSDPVRFDKEVTGESTPEDRTPVKRVRLRGDWSDTGPEARPEQLSATGTTSGSAAEAATESDAGAAAGDRESEETSETDRPEGRGRGRPGNIMERFSGLLTRWFERQMTEGEEEEEETGDERRVRGNEENVLEEGDESMETAGRREEEGDGEGDLVEEKRSADSGDMEEQEPSDCGSGSVLDSSIGEAATGQRSQLPEASGGISKLVFPTGDTEESMAECSTSNRVDVTIRVGTQGMCSSTMRVVLDAAEPILEETPSAEETQEASGRDSESVTAEQTPSAGSGTLAFRIRRGLGRLREGEASSQSQEEREARDARRRRVVTLMEEEAKKRQQKKMEALRTIQEFPQHKCLGVYRGHRNARTMLVWRRGFDEHHRNELKQACFWGMNHVMSGSDCGHFFVWNRHNAKVEMALEADKHVVNCLQPHPTLPILATSGIDYDVKLWAPIAPEASVEEEQLKALMKRNDLMLTETRDTVTIPAAFMIRMIANMNRARIERRRQQLHERMAAEHREEEEETEEGT